ncbi:MAG: hypothetical protein IAX21_06865 [Candidatus Bathyarchaeota archaeon]|nr:hypothetical protein [Candidatus Bathyarchaeum tardum]WGM89337.1 MAG: hypothetical protein NUK63_10595 [Candidatus Bathyarchaeum tardum]WNZ28388.1 MAG: hypothetical protein IAX21_06865 [Candidatus Bathyarchaeota archaeon]
MVRNLEKLEKLERPSDLTKMAMESLDICPSFPKLDLTNIECFSDAGPIVYVDFGLDQIEELEE